MMDPFDQMLRVSLAAARGRRGVLSTGEHLAAALVLNRPDWLQDLGYTLPEALNHLDEGWVELIPRVARAAQEELDAHDEAAAVADEAMRVVAAFTPAESAPEAVGFTASLVTYSHAPGYRDVDLILDLARNDTPIVLQARLRFSPADGVSIMQHIREIHATAWRNGKPIDLCEGEHKPAWLSSDGEE